MPFGLTDKDYQLIKDVFRLYSKVEEVVIFGSRAMGTDKPGSDIDLALKGKHIVLEDILSINNRLEDLPLAYQYDVINYHTINNLALVEHIDKHGIRFYKKEQAPNNWKAYRLVEIADVQTEPSGSQSHRLLSGSCLRVRPKSNKVDPEYLYYYLGFSDFKNKIRAVSVDATMSSLGTSIMNELEVFLPELNQQKSIAAILSSLDDKIELNKQMNQTLEATAQAIFKEWFVNFNFPGFDGQLINGLPKGWKKGDLQPKYPIVVPSEEILKQFQECTDPLFERIYSNILENQLLTSMRDNLLPKLMTGEIQVKSMNS